MLTNNQALYLKFDNFWLSGYGVFCLKDICAGDTLLEYAGDLITKEEGEEREELYQQDGKGNFLFFFDVGRKRYW